jgi:hypothetical protein
LCFLSLLRFSSHPVPTHSLTSDLSFNFLIWHSWFQFAFFVWIFPFLNSLMILWKSSFLFLIHSQSFTIHAVRISYPNIWYAIPSLCCMTFFRFYSM